MSGWQDSNLRPPRPKRGAITGLRYTPIMSVSTFVVYKETTGIKLLCLFYICLLTQTLAERQGFEPWVPISRYDDLANRSFRPLRHLSISFTKNVRIKTRMQMYIFIYYNPTFFLLFFYLKS